MTTAALRKARPLAPTELGIIPHAGPRKGFFAEPAFPIGFFTRRRTSLGLFAMARPATHFFHSSCNTRHSSCHTRSPR